MVFNNKEHAEEIIKEAKDYLERLVITVKDIEEGRVFRSSTGNIIVIPVQTGYNTSMYYLAGLYGKIQPLTPYSNDPLSKYDMVEYLKSKCYEKTNQKLGLVEVK